MSVRNEQGISPDDFNIPDCTVEDVDRALFTLFDKQLPFIYKHKEGLRRSPVVFATGERFAVLRRKQPLRDRAGALILPLVSIMRTGIEAGASMGAGTNQTVEHTIRKRISKEDPIYQRLVNKMGIKNSDDAVSSNAEITTASGSFPGKLASRRSQTELTVAAREGKVLTPQLGNNIFEVTTMAPPKYYVAKYEVTFWAQYTTQMNEMLMSLMSLCQSYSQRTFRIETSKGYWFVAYVADALTPGNNFDDFTEDERLVKYSFEITVPAYIIGDSYTGAPNRLRKFISAPQVAFDANIFLRDWTNIAPANVKSTNPDTHVLDDVLTVDDPAPGQALPTGQVSEIPPGSPQALVGNAVSDSTTDVWEITKDPFTGQTVRKRVLVKTRIKRSGETVLRETIS